MDPGTTWGFIPRINTGMGGICRPAGKHFVDCVHDEWRGIVWGRSGLVTFLRAPGLGFSLFPIGPTFPSSSLVTPTTVLENRGQKNNMGYAKFQFLLLRSFTVHIVNFFFKVCVCISRERERDLVKGHYSERILQGWRRPGQEPGGITALGKTL